MRLLPLTLSAHTSALVSCEEPSSKPQGSGSYGSCRFCGLKTASWQEPFHLNGDHLDHAGENIVAACVLCHLAQHLDRETIDEEATLVWIPELTQGALNALGARRPRDVGGPWTAGRRGPRPSGGRSGFGSGLRGVHGSARAVGKG
ncbi:protein of unknown function (plasmid) [Methylocella tundrae]|uniref:Uncharacterized protein n=1 Tax=Methylocella tundrae TaxID=227605 RepID=A0A4U8Z8W4_METTU|nr:protein of unknown function [Methylocella tundrae]